MFLLDFDEESVEVLTNHFLASQSETYGLSPDTIKAEWPLLRNAVFER